MNFLSLIEAKRDGKEFSADQIERCVKSYVAGDIPDYQMAALLMAVYFRGLNGEETRVLTRAMRDSGEVLHFPKDSRLVVDKHSTGGIGDKVSLPLAPLLACLGFRVPMISGRGLGITGGTLDKMESIPGFNTALPADRIVEIVQEVGCVICGQTDRMVPADKRIYALRDATGTVPSIPLITASILSKKLAEGLEALILDVKFGSAAFMATLEKARELARAMVEIGTEFGVDTRAILTDMNTPLGRAAGNWLEVKESVACLDCKGPEDLQQLVIECAAHLLEQTGKAASLDEGRSRAAACLASGEPRRKWDEMLKAQGADLDAFERKLAREHTAPVLMDVETPDEGFISRCDARIIGEIVRDMGGGRLTKESSVNHDVGIDFLAKPGEVFGVSSTLARIHASSEEQAQEACARLRDAFEVTQEPSKPVPLILEVVRSGQKAH